MTPAPAEPHGTPESAAEGAVAGAAVDLAPADGPPGSAPAEPEIKSPAPGETAADPLGSPTAGSVAATAVVDTVLSSSAVERVAVHSAADSGDSSAAVAEPAVAAETASAALAAAASPATAPASPLCIFRWDLDKTYLQTDFDSFRALLRTAMQKAADKRTVPGAATLLRELRQNGSERGVGSRICFISGSPRQMRKVLIEKLRLDGVEFDEFILKPNLRNMLTGRFRAMREQVGYKLPALLAGRAGVAVETREVCFGDDAESDGFIYSLYGDVLAGRVERPLLERVLTEPGVYPTDAARTVALVESLPRGEAVERIFIHLDRRSPPSRFDRYGARLVPIYNYFQAALVLYQDCRLSPGAVVRVAVEMVDKHGYSLEALRNSLQDMLRRSRLQLGAVRALGSAIASGAGGTDLLPALGALPSTRGLLRSLAHGLLDLGPLSERELLPPAQSANIDYLQALEQDLPRHRARK